MSQPLENEQFEQQLELLSTHRKTLLYLLKQQSQIGTYHTPPSVAHGIDEARQHIRALKQNLRDKGYTVDDQSFDEAITTTLRQIPSQPKFYVPRQVVEQQLRELLVSHDEKPLITLSGLSGTGKTTLAAYIARSLKYEDFPDGILWGNLENGTSNDLLLRFLGSLDSQWYRNNLDKNISRSDIFWQSFSNKRVLIVFDGISSSKQLLELLPKTASVVNDCRILAISIQPLNDPEIDNHALKLGYFNHTETIDLFRCHMGDEQVQRFSAVLTDIGTQLEHHPQLIATAARDFAAKRATPSAYLQRLRQSESQGELLSNSLRDGLNLAVRDLTSEELDVFDQIGVLGEGDWSEAMLAAVTLRSPETINRIIETLINYELIVPVGDQRYRVSALIREYIRKRFEQREPFIQQIAYTLLARYCLDLAQDLDAALAEQYGYNSLLNCPINRSDAGYIQAFRAGLLPEMPHISQILDWAERYEIWELLLRFSYLPYLELLKNMVANAFEVQIALKMATIIEPIIWAEGEHQSIKFSSLITSKYWMCGPISNFNASREPDTAIDGFELSFNQSPNPNSGCELSLEIMAGHIVNGTFQNMRLTDTRWVGVRAPGLICSNITIIVGNFLACDFSNSIWINCAAQQITMLASNLKQALFRQVNLHGGNFHGVHLTGAILENVDLRGANLRGAIFDGAVLDDVDFRGADLRGAQFIATEGRKINLLGCKLDGTRWYGAQLYDVRTDDSAVQDHLVQSSHENINILREQFRRRPRPIKQLFSPKEKKFQKTDLRAIDLSGKNLENFSFAQADMRGINLSKANLRYADLRQADLRNAKTKSVNFSNASLREANLSTAILDDANFESADLTDVTMRAAQLGQAKLYRAILENTNLRSANLQKAFLAHALMVNCNLEQAQLCDADLTYADLQSACLQAANFARANLTDANITNAICTGTNFQGATISDEQLAQTRRLDNTILPTGQSVKVFDGIIKDEFMSADAFLRFAQLDGDLHKIELISRDLYGARLDGKFTTVNFSGSNLSHARLTGRFSQAQFTGCNLSNASITGLFSASDFRNANFADTNLQGVTLIHCNLLGARNLTEAMLKQVKQLRGCTMPDGKRYNGIFNLRGDIEDARNLGFDPDNPTEMLLEYYLPEYPKIKLSPR